MVCAQVIVCTKTLSWDAYYDQTQARSYFISYVDMYLHFKKVMGNRFSYISKTDIKRNNKYLTSYDPNGSTKYNTY